MKTPIVDETDLVLISALQDAPRAKWAELAPILGIGEAALAERWRRISEGGLAWVTLADRRVDQSFMAFLLIESRHGHQRRLLDELRDDPHVRTIHSVTGDYDLVVLLEFGNAAAAEQFLHHELGRSNAVARKRVLPVAHAISQAAQWRTAALNGTQRQALALIGTFQPRHQSEIDSTWIERDKLAVAILDELAVNGRMSVIELTLRINEAHAMGVSVSTVRRKLDRVLRAVRIRCDVSSSDIGWKAVVMLWCRLSSPEVARMLADKGATATTVQRSFPEIRSMLVVTGSVNLHFTLWLHSLDALPQVESRLFSWLPSIQIEERSLTLSNPKRMGFPLHRGRRITRLPPRGRDLGAT